MTHSQPITIRRAEPSDYESICRVYAGPKALAGTLGLPYHSLEAWRKRLAEIPDSAYMLVACVNTEIVGQLSLKTSPNLARRRHVGQLGMAVRDDWQGQGVGTALMAAALDLADNWLNLHRIELEVYTDNPAAIRLYEKFGFQNEGLLIDFAFRNGEYINAYYMGRIRPKKSN